MDVQNKQNPPQHFETRNQNQTEKKNRQQTEKIVLRLLI